MSDRVQLSCKTLEDAIYIPGDCDLSNEVCGTLCDPSQPRSMLCLSLPCCVPEKRSAQTTTVLSLLSGLGPWGGPAGGGKKGGQEGQSVLSPSLHLYAAAPGVAEPPNSWSHSLAQDSPHTAFPTPHPSDLGLVILLLLTSGHSILPSPTPMQSLM